MSKVSNSSPDYSGSNVNIGGSNAYSGMLNGQHVSNYKMSDSDSQIYNYALDSIAKILPSINTFSPETLLGFENSINAYKDSGIKKIDSYYDKSLSALKNDIVSRFGNLDNSMFNQSLNNLEQNRADSVSNFAQSIMAKQNELISNELNQRYALVNFLNGLSNNIYTKALNTHGLALNGSSKLNRYNNNLYNTTSANDYRSTQMDSAAMNALLSTVATALL